MTKQIKLYTRDDLDALLLLARECVESAPHVAELRRIVEGRTIKQNKSLHKYCDMQAMKLNDAGFTQKKLFEALKPGFDLPVTMHLVKSIFRSVGLDMYRKESTADLSTVEIQKVYEAVDQGFGETTGVRTEWPSREAPPMGER